MRIDHSKERSRLWLKVLGGAGWLGGAGPSWLWMLHGGGFARPLALFAAWVAVLAFVMVRALDMTPDATSSAKKAMRYTACSVVALALGALFLEYWPVTVSMAFMFAICRTIKGEDTLAFS